MFHAVNIIRDIIYQDGRFPPVSECIDSDRDGWQQLSRMAGMQHSASGGWTAHRVYVAQALSAPSDGCAGDLAYGYGLYEDADDAGFS